MAEHAGQLRLLIATDNHLGVWEDDEIRKHDSFVTFEEILQHAHRLRVDALLLGGDLFHENKPSRPTTVRTIELLRKYVMSDNPVNIQVLSDQESNFSLNKRVNYEDPNFNIGLPIFIIHGNHDEPAGADNLSAIDILAACNLVNYYGKTGMSGAGAGKFQVDIAPVLIQKGDTRLALYGLGYMRDSRLYRMMTTTGDVTWRRPADAPGAPADSWFNLFFIHQNHAQRGSKSAVSEKQLPKWLNLVVWGHEHASKTEPTPSSEGTFEVSQPGSSVHTTLSEDEARPKKIMLLTLKGEDWKAETLQLRTVRPFVFENIALRDEPTLAARPDDAEAVARFLHAAVDNAIARALAQAEAEGAAGPATAPPDAAGGAAPAAVLPLVRLRVDHSGGFPTVPLQRFGSAFQGRVANPWDLLQFHKSATKRAKMERGPAADAGVAAPEEAAEGTEANEHRRIDALVAQHLPAQLQILTEGDMALALEDFVQRDEKNALADAVRAALDESQRKVAAHGMPAGAADDPGEMLKTIKVVVQEMHAGKPARATAARAAPTDGAGPSGAARADVEMTAADDDDEAPAARSKAAPKPRAKAAAAKPKAAAKGGKQATVAGMFGRAAGGGTADDGADDESSPARRPPARRAAAAKKKTYAESDGEGADGSEDDFAAGKGGEEESSDGDAFDEDAEDSPRPKRKAPAAKAAAKGKGKAAAAAPKRGRAAAADEVVEIEDSDDDVAPKPKRAATASRAAPSVAGSAPSQPQTGATATATARGWGSLRR